MFSFVPAFLVAASMVAAPAPSAMSLAPAAIVVADTTFDAKGPYELYIDIQGNVLPLALELWMEEDKWLGTMTAQQMGTTNLTSIKIEGRILKLELPAPGGQGSVAMELEVKTDNVVVGSLMVQGNAIPIGGKKVVKDGGTAAR
jgi:hypothetical protein